MFPVIVWHFIRWFRKELTLYDVELSLPVFGFTFGITGFLIKMSFNVALKITYSFMISCLECIIVIVVPYEFPMGIKHTMNFMKVPWTVIKKICTLLSPRLRNSTRVCDFYCVGHTILFSDSSIESVILLSWYKCLLHMSRYTFVDFYFPSVVSII